MGKIYLANAFSLQMIKNFPVSINIYEIGSIGAEAICKRTNLPAEHREHIISAVGHPDTAAVLGVPCNRIYVSLEKGDTLYVAQLVGGRLPEGCITLPEGFTIKFLEVVIDYFPSNF